jgi:hypothetical protein
MEQLQAREHPNRHAPRYEARTVAYAPLVTERYPSLGGGPTA